MRNTVLQVCLYALVAATSMAIGRLIPDVGFGGAALAIAASVLVVVAVVVGVSLAKEKRVEELMRRLVADVRAELIGVLERYRLQLAEGFGSEVMNTEAVVAFEESCGPVHVYIVTTNMERDRPGEPVFDVVMKNVDRGVRYTYVCVASPETRAKVADVRKFLGDSASSVGFVLVDRGGLEGITEADLVVYEFDHTEAVVIIAVPVRDRPDQYVWIRLHRDFAYRVAGRVRDVVRATAAEA